jgi:CHASE2 domain-containing sensor protein
MKKFWTDVVMATVMVFLAMWGLSGVTRLNVFSAFDSIGTALSDIELTDYVFSQLREDPLVDTSIVIVNIGTLGRRGIAEEIKIISKYHPKVIGIDSFFGCRSGLRDTVNCPQLKDVMGNLMLADAIREAGNVVLVSKVTQTKKLAATNTLDVYDSVRRSDDVFIDGALIQGYANLETDAAFQDDVKTCRRFNPRINVKDTAHYAFGVQLAMAYDSAKTKELLARGNYSEVISYRGNVVDLFGQTNYRQMYYTLDASDVLSENFAPGMIKDKIVIFGYLGEYLGDPSWADKFYTPLNKKLAGKANPDMFGVVVHANIVSMILSGDYINEMPDWLEYAMAILFCFMNVALFSIISRELPLWYDGITKVLQFAQLIIYSMLMVFIFHWYAFKLNITYTLVAVALVGDVFEIYMNIIKMLFFKITDWVGFTNKADRVLTS